MCYEEFLRAIYRSLEGVRAKADLEAMFIWSNLLGLVSISESSVMDHLQLAKGVSSKKAKAKLFERHCRGLQLTPAGDHLLKHAHEVIAVAVPKAWQSAKLAFSILDE
jgi:hypothetical protein